MIAQQKPCVMKIALTLPLFCEWEMDVEVKQMDN
jgi:hypothetical protein